MPSPLAHSLAGYGYYRWQAGQNPSSKAGLWRAALFIVFSNAPDLHYLPGLLVGEPSRFHFAYLHSLGFLAAMAALLYVVLDFTRTRDSLGWSKHFFVLSALHIVMDFLCQNLTQDSGIALFWPVSIRLFSAPFHVFVDLRKNGMDQILSTDNFGALGREVIVMGVALGLLVWRERRRKRVGGA
jgi:hypothetical protein